MAALQAALEVVEAAEKSAACTQAVRLETPVERDIGQEGDSGDPKSSPTAESSKAPPRAPAPKLPVAAALGSGRSSDRISGDEDVGSTSSGKCSRGDDTEPEVLSSDEELRGGDPRKPISSASKSAPALTPRGAPPVFSALLRMVRAAQSIILAIVAAGTGRNSTQGPSNTEAAAVGTTASKALKSAKPDPAANGTPPFGCAFSADGSCGAEHHSGYSGCRYSPEIYSEAVEFRGRCRGRYCQKGCAFCRWRSER